MNEKSQHTAENKAGDRLAARSIRLPWKCSVLIQNPPFACIFRSSRRHLFISVRIYYRERRFIEHVARLKPVQFCSIMAQSRRNFHSDSSIDDEK
jgi:hypothetical protein